MASLAHPRGHLGVQLEGHRRRGHGDGHRGLVEDASEAPHAGAAAVLVVGLRAGVAPRRLDARIRVLAPTLVAVVAPEHRCLRPLLVHQHEVDDDVGAVRPCESWRCAAVPGEIALPDRLGDHGAPSASITRETAATSASFSSRRPMLIRTSEPRGRMTTPCVNTEAANEVAIDGAEQSTATKFPPEA